MQWSVDKTTIGYGRNTFQLLYALCDVWLPFPATGAYGRSSSKVPTTAIVFEIDWWNI